MDVLLSGTKGKFLRLTQVLLVIVLCLGLLFRFAQLDQKVYWMDEVSTGLRVSGFTMRDVQKQIVDGPPLSVDQLKKYQYPNAGKGAADTVNSLVIEDTQHPPLFFLLLRFWVSLFGNSLTALRSLAAVFSLLMLPAAWFFCRELFGSRAVGWIAVVLLAVSPLQIVYAQEARHYSLWMLLILLSSTVLLRSLRQGHWRNWALYSLSVAFGLYTHLFFGLIALGHGLYTICTERFQWTHSVRAYLMSLAIAIVTFVPWLFVLMNRDQELKGVGWMDESTSLARMIVRIFGILSRTFVDFGVSPTDSRSAMLVVAPLMLLTLGASLVGFVVMIRQTPFRVWFFVATLAGVTGAVIVLSYGVLGKQIATTRYMLPIALSLHLAVAYLIAEAFRLPQRLWGNAIAWRTLAAVIVSVGVLSCALRFNTPVWWNQLPEFHRDTPAIAQTLNQTENAKVIVDATTGEFNILIFYGMLHLLNQNNVQFQFVNDKDPRPLLQPRQQKTFVYVPFVVSPEALQQLFSTKYRGVKLERRFDALWQVLP